MLTQMDVRLRIFSCLWIAMTMIGAGAKQNRQRFPTKPLSLQVFKYEVVERKYVEMWRLEFHPSLGVVATDSWFSFRSVVTPGEPEYLTMDGQTRLNGVCAGRGLHYSGTQFTYADDTYAVLSRDTPFPTTTLKPVYVYFSSHPDQYLLYLACLDRATIDYHCEGGLPKSCGGDSYVGFVAPEDANLSDETYVIPTSRINLKDVGKDLESQLGLQFDDVASHFLLVYGPCDNTPTNQ